MSTLLQQIENCDPCVAPVLKEAEFQTDAEIQTLTLEDLFDLFPGKKNLKLRIKIFKIIFKQKKIHPFLEKLEDVTQQDSLRGAVINECFKRIKEARDLLDKTQNDFKCSSNISEDNSQSLDSEKESRESAETAAFVCQPPTALPSEPEPASDPPYQEEDFIILPYSGETAAASVCQPPTDPPSEPKPASKPPHQEGEVDFQTDCVIYILYRDGLRELFPGSKCLKLRKTIFEIFHNQKLTHLLEELKGFIPQDSSRDAAVVKHPERMENIKKQLDEMQDVLTAYHMSKDHSRSLDSGKEKGSGGRFSRFWPFGLPQKSPENVRYKMVVCGETFGAHQQLLNKIETPDLKMIEGEEHDIIIVFCPVTSRQGTDAEAAMKMVPGGGPVILVFMHYSQEPKHVSSSKILSSSPNVVLEVNIFYHDRKNGLLMCGQNENAVTELKEELKKYSRP